MDLSKTQQKYKHYACLCISVMGQRRFRISMGALIPSPEAGDASVIIPQMKKCSITDDSSKSFVSMSERDIVNQRSLMSSSTYNCINDVDKVAYKHMILMGDSVFDEMSNSTIYDKCQFPYYRSSKNSGRFPDAVLVKDVGVSCMLLDEDTPVIHIPETKTLIKQLKKEYNDLSDITNKITTYTKDILGQLRKKDKRKRELLQHLMASKHAISSQYIDDKGNLCLKLRLLSNTGTQYTSEHIIKNLEDALKDKCIPKKLHCKHSSTQIMHKDKTPKSKHEKDVQTEIHKEDVETSTTNSSSPSSSSVYNYLMMRKGKASSGKLKPVSAKLDDAEKYWNCKTRNNKDCKEHLKRCDPVIFTSWKEISKSKQSKIKASSVISDELQEMTTTKKATSQKLLLNRNIINNLPNTKIHSVNIRIVKQKKRPI